MVLCRVYFPTVLLLFPSYHWSTLFLALFSTIRIEQKKIWKALHNAFDMRYNSNGNNTTGSNNNYKTLPHSKYNTNNLPRISIAKSFHLLFLLAWHHPFIKLDMYEMWWSMDRSTMINLRVCDCEINRFVDKCKTKKYIQSIVVVVVVNERAMKEIKNSKSLCSVACMMRSICTNYISIF